MPKALNETIKKIIVDEVERHKQGIYAFELKNSGNCKNIRRSTFYWYLDRLAAKDIIVVSIGGTPSRPHTMLILPKKPSK